MLKNAEVMRKRSIPVGSESSHPPSLSQAFRRKSKVPGPLTSLDTVAGIHYKMGRRISVLRRGSLAPSSRTDASLQPPVKLENTYRLGPGENERFKSCEVQRVVEGILESFLCGEEYDPQTSARLSQQLCDVIKARVREMNVPRYKLVCHVIIGANLNQCFLNSSRCIWNTDTDNCASATYKNATLFAVASVYAMYYE